MNMWFRLAATLTEVRHVGDAASCLGLSTE